MVNQKNVGPIGPKAIDASIALVEKAAHPFASVVRMSALDRKRAAKLKRGAHQVIPTIAHLATKFAVELPGSPISVMLSEIAHAQALEPLLGAVAALHETLRDEYLRSQSNAWKTASRTYGMLRVAGEVNAAVRTELEPVQTWFRHRAAKKTSSSSSSSSRKTAAAGPAVGATIVPATPPAPADTKPVSKSNGIVNGIGGAASAAPGA
jgi:hypothetical protein